MKKKLGIIVVVIMLVVCMSCLAACNVVNPDTSYDIIKKTKSENFALLNKTAKSGQVVMMGDSIVELYPEELFDDISLKVYNRGISGDTSDRMLERLESNALNIKPRALSVLIGTNDLGKGKSDTFTFDNVKKCIDDAKAAGVERIIIQSIYPVNKPVNSEMVGVRTNKQIIEMNVGLKKLCEDNGAIYVDVFTALKDNDGNFTMAYTYDGLHPNAAGYKVITEVLRPHFVF